MASCYFQGPHVLLKPFEPADAAGLLGILNHPELAGRRHLSDGYTEWTSMTLLQVETLLGGWAEEKNGFHLAVWLHESSELAGYVSCSWHWDTHCPEVSLVISPLRQNQGYGSETLDLILTYIFETTPAHNVSLWMADWNKPARRFAAKNGFRESGCMRREGLCDGKYFDLILTDILRPEWQMQKGGGEACRLKEF